MDAPFITPTVTRGGTDTDTRFSEVSLPASFGWCQLTHGGYTVTSNMEASCAQTTSITQGTKHTTPQTGTSSTSPLHTGTPSPRVAHTRANSSLTELKTLRRVTPALASSDFKALLRLANMRRCRAISLIRTPSANPNPPHNSQHQSLCPCCCCMLQIAIITQGPVG